MLKLITREIRDHAVYIGACWFFTAVIVGILIGTFTWDFEPGGFAFSAGVMLIMYIGFCVLGAAQMYGDRAHRLSALLTTQAATRNRVLTARILVGVLTVLIGLVPTYVTATVLLRLEVQPFGFYLHMIRDVSLVLTLIGLACYCAGLMVGWTGSRAWLITGSVILVTLLVMVPCAKGFGLGAVLLLLVLITAMLGRVWHTFTTASL